MKKRIRRCKVCKRTEKEVFIGKTMSYCGDCWKVLKKSKYRKSTEITGKILAWQSKNKRLAQSFLKGVDPCLKCQIGDCEFCCIRYTKKKFVDYMDEGAKECLSMFIDELKVRITAFYKEAGKRSEDEV